MNILIAHPNRSYVSAVRQMLRSQDLNYKIEGAITLAELADRVSQDAYDILLLDADFAGTNMEAFFQVLTTLVYDCHIILTVNNSSDQIARRALHLGIKDCVEKKSGYLLTLTKSIKKVASEKKNSEMVAPTSLDLPARTEENEASGTFVCDRRGRFLSVDQSIQDICGYSKEELLQLSIIDLLHEDLEENFLKNIFEMAVQNPDSGMKIRMNDKFGHVQLCDLRMRALRDDSHGGQIIGFRGTLVKATSEQHEQSLQKHHIDQNQMINEITDLVHVSYSEPLNIFLRRIAEVICQVFKFQRSTLALLDRRKQVFVKQAMVGYSEVEGQSLEHRALQVPREVIDRIFVDRYRIKVIYYDQDSSQEAGEPNPTVPERRTQKRRPLNEWHKRDLVLLNLKDQKGNTFGYISLDDPQAGIIPTRSTFYNLELVSQLISMSIENYYRFMTLQKNNRRLKQMLADSSIFKLHLSLTDLLNEICWSAKYTLEFNLVSLVLVSKKTQQLETKAVACDDKIKQVQIRELCYDVRDFSDLLRDEYRIGKSYLIDKDEKQLNHLKQIYYGSDSNLRYGDGWPNWAALLVPVKSRDGKIIGFFIADDPHDCKMPTFDIVQTLEILANQVAIAIDNRVMYVQAKESRNGNGVEHLGEATLLEMKENQDNFEEEEIAEGGFKKLVERFLR